LISEFQSKRASEMIDVDTTVAELRDQIAQLQQLMLQVNEESKNRLMQSQLRAAAVQAGMVDLDGLKLIDVSRTKPNDYGELEGVADFMAEVKREKPWLFGGQSSSSRANPPPAQPVRAKSASEMTDDEYRAARAELLRRR
jgi:hypothetical protein